MRPIIFFDFESTGSDPRSDRIVEMAFIKYDPKTFKQLDTLYSLVNPKVPIPKAASDVHKITDSKVKKSPSFFDLMMKVRKMIDGCDLAGYNSNNFDVPLLASEFDRNGGFWDITQHQFIDICRIYTRKESRTLSDACKLYLGREHFGAHGAMADTLVTAQVFMKQLERYPDLKDLDIKAIDLFCNYDKQRVDLDNFFYSDNGVLFFSKGKYKGQRADIDPSYLEWILLGKNRFSTSTKMVAKVILEQLKTKK